MKNFILSIFLLFQIHIIQAQSNAVMFHGCEMHCGVYPEKEYTNFERVKWKFKTNGKIFSSPAILNGVAYVGSEDKNLYAIDLLTGKLKWKFKTDGAVHSSPAVYQNVIYVGSFDGHYYAVNADTGKEIWNVKTNGEKWVGGKGYWGMKPISQYMEDPWDFFLSSPIIDKNDEDLTLYFGSSDGNLYAVSAKNGTIKWKFQTNGIIHGSPALYEGMLYIGSWDTYLYAIDATTGKEQWKFKTGDQMGMTGIQSSPLVKNDIVYFGARDANFYALKTDNGELVWKYNSEGSWIISTATLKDSTLYVGTSDSFLMLALNAKTGREKFRFKANGYVMSSPALVGNTAFFGDMTGNLFALNVTSEGKKWNTFSTASRQKKASAFLKDDNLDFQYAAKGKDLSLYKSTVEVMNELYTLGSIVSSSVIQQGIIYFGSAEGYVYAVQLKDEAPFMSDQHPVDH